MLTDTARYPCAPYRVWPAHAFWGHTPDGTCFCHGCSCTECPECATEVAP